MPGDTIAEEDGGAADDEVREDRGQDGVAYSLFTLV